MLTACWGKSRRGTESTAAWGNIDHEYDREAWMLCVGLGQYLEDFLNGKETSRYGCWMVGSGGGRAGCTIVRQMAQIQGAVNFSVGSEPGGILSGCFLLSYKYLYTTLHTKLLQDSPPQQVDRVLVAPVI